MGFLARRGNSEPATANLLGLPSRYSMPSDVRKERDREVGKAIARGQVIATDIRAIEHASLVGIASAESIATVAQAAVNRTPLVQPCVGHILEQATRAIGSKISELGGGHF